MNLTFRLCRRGDEEKLVSFHHRARGLDSRPEFWRWKYFENPAGPACVSIALDGERVVGRLGFIPNRIRVGTRTVTAAQQVDSDILESHRRGGTYFRLARIVEKEGQKRGLAFGFGFSSAATRQISTEALGFSMVTPVARIVKVLDPAHYLRERLKIPLRYLPGGAFKRLIKWREERRAIDGVDSEEIFEFDGRFNDLWQDSDPGKIMLVKDSTYLDWRYFKCPTVRYKIVAASQRGELKGFIAIQLKLADGIKHGIIADLICRTDNPRIVESLLSNAIDYFFQQGAVGIKCWLPQNHPFYPVLRKRGFRERATRVTLLVMPSERSDTPADVLKNGQNWSYVLGDSDLHLLADS